MRLIDKYRHPVGKWITCRKCHKPMTGYSKDIPNPLYQFHTACNPSDPIRVAQLEERERAKLEFFASKKAERTMQ